MAHPLGRVSGPIRGIRGLLAALDRLPEAIAVHEHSGELIWANRGFHALGSPVVDAVAAGSRKLLLDIASGESGACEPQCTAEWTLDPGFRVRVVVFHGPPLSDGWGALAIVQRETPPIAPDADLHARYGLSSKEAKVARLLATGASNDEVARSLCISPHTARHHTERVLAKLNVRSRAAVAGRIISG